MQHSRELSINSTSSITQLKKQSPNFYKWSVPKNVLSTFSFHSMKLVSLYSNKVFPTLISRKCISIYTPPSPLTHKHLRPHTFLGINMPSPIHPHPYYHPPHPVPFTVPHALTASKRQSIMVFSFSILAFTLTLVTLSASAAADTSSNVANYPEHNYLEGRPLELSKESHGFGSLDRFAIQSVAPAPSTCRCVRGRCFRPSPRGGSCSARGSCCSSGLTCAGRRRRRVCVTPMREGGRCNTDPKWVCASGLMCVNNVCRAPVGRFGSCQSRDSVCAAGLTCVGPSRRRLCVELMGENRRCGTDPYWICASGLQCVGNLCRREVRRIARGRSCSRSGSVCADGLMCLGSRRRRVCVSVVRAGGRCRRSGSVCTRGYICARGRCRRSRH